ncbi:MULTISPECIES: GNAT family N-acetyltransferase [Bacillaceae]|uniref:GNAT family N-acetyltransferase n=1 Tax=Evansella alkalicola TaxID=745819 RepID=A0ABS6JPX0_9BACI|nr:MULTISPECIES: GNAT family N-acetyltransferase [Bacillaceae]MBU9720604.1 GNAT family N-acetyltransferase [Bacillus alkalicola]
MNKEFRQLTNEDITYFLAMDTGIEDDYVARIFERLTGDTHRLYGIFIDNQMVTMGGFSIFAGNYAMLGRLRSDIRFRGNNLATDLLSAVMDEAFKMEQIRWIGANTQEHNIPARRVVEKLGLHNYTTLHGALTTDVSVLETGSKVWRPVTCLDRKKYWLDEAFIKPKALFPYECYYPLPSSENLFKDELIDKWSFYENETKTRIVITKYDQKKDHYLHAIYPWSDFSTQKGLWETISLEYRQLKDQVVGNCYIWLDIKKEEVESLPKDHNFELPSPWMLYGIERQ